MNNARRVAMPAVDAYDNWRKREAPTHPATSPGGPWYHASDYSLQPGAVLTPGGGRSQWTPLYQDKKHEGFNGGDVSNRPDWVWVGRDPRWTSQWGTYLYEVEPQVEGPWAWNGDGREGYVTPSAKILRRVPRGEAATRPSPPQGAPVHTAALTDWTEHVRDDGTPYWSHPTFDMQIRADDTDPSLHQLWGGIAGAPGYAKMNAPATFDAIIDRIDREVDTPRRRSEQRRDRRRQMWQQVRDRMSLHPRTAMPAPMPEGVTFHYHPTDDTIRRDEHGATGFVAPAVEARHDGKTVGHLEWYPAQLFGDDGYGFDDGDFADLDDDDNGIDDTVSMIHVLEPYRRHGIGTAMFDWARRNANPRLRHSPIRSDLGEQWIDYERHRPDRLVTAGVEVRPYEDDAAAAYDGDRPVGYADVSPDGYIGSMVVHPDYRRQGIGTALMNHLIDHTEGGATLRGSHAFSPAGRAVYDKMRRLRPDRVLDPGKVDLFSGRFVQDGLPEEFRGFTDAWNDEDSARENLQSEIRNRARMQDHYGPEFGRDHLNELDHGIGELKSDFQRQYGHDWRTARATIPYLRNNTGLRKHVTYDDFSQRLEPWGRYMSPDHEDAILRPGWERGEAEFDNPLYLDHAYGDWKRHLSDQYGLTGHELSDALLADGYDGVITGDRYGIGEMVDIRPKDQRVFRVSTRRRAADVPDYRMPYHHTSPESADSIRQYGFRPGREKKSRPDAVLFTASPKSEYAPAFGGGQASLRVPSSMFGDELGEFGGPNAGRLDDELPDGEKLPAQHLMRRGWIQR